jgi:hypothetical protein
MVFLTSVTAGRAPIAKGNLVLRIVESLVLRGSVSPGLCAASGSSGAVGGHMAGIASRYTTLVLRSTVQCLPTKGLDG